MSNELEVAFQAGFEKESGIDKEAFFAMAPFSSGASGDPKDYDTFGNYMRERGDTILGSLTGVAAGGGPGAAIGGALGGRKGALIGGALGAIPGSITGGVRSLRESERRQGVEPTDVGQYFGRALPAGAAAGLTGAGALASMPVDYYVSRNMQDHGQPGIDSNSDSQSNTQPKQDNQANNE